MPWLILALITAAVMYVTRRLERHDPDNVQHLLRVRMAGIIVASFCWLLYLTVRTIAGAA